MYLVWADTDEPLELDEPGPAIELAPRLYLVESELTQSRLYHVVKWSLPTDTPLLVACLDGTPKFKGMAPGATAWVRTRAPG